MIKEGYNDKNTIQRRINKMEELDKKSCFIGSR